MSVARAEFLRRLNSYRLAADHEMLVDKGPAEQGHNERARLLRNGLIVVGFATLEQFIKARTSECLGRLSGANVKFAALPEKLRDACTEGVVRALRFQVDLVRRNGEDVTKFIHSTAVALASTAGPGYRLSPLAFGSERSNLNDADVHAILSAFHVHDPWGSIDKVAARVGLAAPTLREAFRNATKWRNDGAHAPDANTEVTDLRFYSQHALGVALAFEVLISRACRRIGQADVSILDGSKRVQPADIRFRFLDPSGTGWREVQEGRKRAVRVSPTVEPLRREAEPRARARDEVLVVRDARSLPLEWVLPDA